MWLHKWFPVRRKGSKFQQWIVGTLLNGTQTSDPNVLQKNIAFCPPHWIQCLLKFSLASLHNCTKQQQQKNPELTNKCLRVEPITADDLIFSFPAHQTPLLTAASRRRSADWCPEWAGPRRSGSAAWSPVRHWEYWRLQRWPGWPSYCQNLKEHFKFCKKKHMVAWLREH